MLKKVFTELVQQYTTDELVINRLWSEIEKAYSGKKRYYHTLSHLEALYYSLLENKQVITNWNTVLFSLFYHDIVYNVLKSDNEQKSANIAVKRLHEIGLAKQQTDMCCCQILATSNHLVSNDIDANVLIDADLSILGKKRPAYEKYCEQIRKEYSIFPDFVYLPGRRKVLNHFLQMERIYKTNIFFDEFELQARENLNWELTKLSG